MNFILVFFDVLFRVITLLVLAHVILSFFMSPYHPIRAMVDRFVNPLLMPIRRVMPQTGMLDFSPMILILLLQVIQAILRQLLY